MKHISWAHHPDPALMFGLRTGFRAQEGAPTIEDVKRSLPRTRRGRTPLTSPSMRGCITSIGGSTRPETVGRTSRPSSSGRPLPAQSGSSAGKVRAVNLQADFNDDGTDDVDEFGFGDIDLRIMNIPYFNPAKKFALALGVEFFLNTASEDALGAGATSVAPLVFLGFFNPLGPGTVFFPGYQHTFSIDEDDGRSQGPPGVD